MATVIINLVSAIPWIGNDTKELIWGAYSVSSPTVTRFFTLHYTLAFILAALAAVHLIALHEHGSGNPLGITSNSDRLPMHPYYSIKDSITVIALLLITAWLVSFIPNVLGLYQEWPFFLSIIFNSMDWKTQCAICWNYLICKITLIISDVDHPDKVTLFYNFLHKGILCKIEEPIKGNQYNQQMASKISTLVISETTCTQKNKNIKDLKFNQWLAGLIDGDGSLLVSKQGYTSCEITTSLEDEKALRIIQNKLGGSIKLRSGVKAVRYRLQNKEGMLKLIHKINGYIRNTKRLPQLHKVCSILNIETVSAWPLTSSNSWFTGFFDADGTINFYYQSSREKDGTIIRPQLYISVTNKYIQDVFDFQTFFGGQIYYDSAQNGYYKWSITSKELHMVWYNLAKTNAGHSIKWNRVFLIKQYYELCDLKAYRAAPNSSIFKAWRLFEIKWNRKTYL